MNFFVGSKKVEGEGSNPAVVIDILHFYFFLRSFGIVVGVLLKGNLSYLAMNLALWLLSL